MTSYARPIKIFKLHNTGPIILWLCCKQFLNVSAPYIIKSYKNDVQYCVTWHTRSFIFKFWILIRIIFINLDMYWGIYTRYDWSTCESKQILMKWAIYILKCLVILKLLIFNLHISSQNQMANYEEI